MSSVAMNDSHGRNTIGRGNNLDFFCGRSCFRVPFGVGMVPIVQSSSSEERSADLRVANDSSVSDASVVTDGEL